MIRILSLNAFRRTVKPLSPPDPNGFPTQSTGSNEVLLRIIADIDITVRWSAESFLNSQEGFNVGFFVRRAQGRCQYYLLKPPADTESIDLVALRAFWPIGDEGEINPTLKTFEATIGVRSHIDARPMSPI